MKTPRIVLPVFLALTSGLPAAQQTTSPPAAPPPVFAATTYYHVDDASRSAYEAFIKDKTRSLLTGLLKEDPSLRMGLMATLVFGGNPEPRGNYALTLISDAVPNPGIQEARLNASSQKTLGKPFSEYLREVLPLRTTAGQILTWQGASTPPAVDEGDCMYVHWKKIAAGRMADYIKMEQQFQRLREAQVKAGTMKSWSMWTVVLPGGMERTYDACTVHIAKDLASVLNWGQRQQEIVANMVPPFTHPTAEYVNAVGTQARLEVWRVVMAVKR